MTEILSKLKRAADHVKSLGYFPVYISLYGSQNYGLSFHRDGYISDYDYKCIVMPSFREITEEKEAASLTSDFEGGQIIGLLGPNGSGKTSLIKILTGLINDYSGEVLIDGNKPGKISKSKVAFLPEKTYLASWMNTDDAVNYIADFYDDFDKAKAMHMIDVFQCVS